MYPPNQTYKEFMLAYNQNTQAGGEESDSDSNPTRKQLDYQNPYRNNTGGLLGSTNGTHGFYDENSDSGSSNGQEGEGEEESFNLKEQTLNLPKAEPYQSQETYTNGKNLLDQKTEIFSDLKKYSSKKKPGSSKQPQDFLPGTPGSFQNQSLRNFAAGKKGSKKAAKKPPIASNNTSFASNQKIPPQPTSKNPKTSKKKDGKSYLLETDVNELIEETNDFYKLQIYELESLLNKISSELQSSLDREQKTQHQLSAITNSSSLKDQEYLTTISTQKSEFLTLKKKFAQLQETQNSALETDAKTTISKEIKIFAENHYKTDSKTSKTTKTEELEYCLSLEAKVELLNQKLKNFSSSETSYKISIENYKQMIETKYRDEIQELKLTLSTMLDVNDFSSKKISSVKSQKSDRKGVRVGCGERSHVCYEYLKENGELKKQNKILERKYDELVRAKAKSVLVGNDADKWRSELEEAMGNELKWKNRYTKLKSSKFFFFGMF
jgi:hypothetical protein